jgi:hypothetical protein
MFSPTLKHRLNHRGVVVVVVVVVVDERYVDDLIEVLASVVVELERIG